MSKKDIKVRVQQIAKSPLVLKAVYRLKRLSLSFLHFLVHLMHRLGQFMSTSLWENYDGEWHTQAHDPKHKIRRPRNMSALGGKNVKNPTGNINNNFF